MKRALVLVAALVAPLLIYAQGSTAGPSPDFQPAREPALLSPDGEMEIRQYFKTGDEYVFRGPEVKRMTAEQFMDAVWRITGAGPSAPDVPNARRGAAATADPPAGPSPAPVRAALMKNNLLMRSLGRPNREQVVTTRPDQLTTLEALDLSNGQILTDLLAHGAANMLKEKPKATADERMAYLKRANAVRRGTNGESEENGGNGADGEEATGAIELGERRYVEMSAAEQFVLTISEKGFGKRTSSYEYRTTGRGGKGIVAMAVTARNGRIVASFPVEEADQIMLVTNRGQLIRCPVDGIRIAGRGTQGVIVFDTAEGERVVSVERLSEENGEE